MQIRAPGCPVIIVGTHLDQMHDSARVEELENKARQRFSDEKYPQVSISCSSGDVILWGRDDRSGS